MELQPGVKEIRYFTSFLMQPEEQEQISELFAQLYNVADGMNDENFWERYDAAAVELGKIIPQLKPLRSRQRLSEICMGMLQHYTELAYR